VTGPASVNGISVLSVNLKTFWRGAWLAELVVDPDLVAQAPSSGRVTITIGAPTPVATLSGTIDPRYSGSFGSTVRLTVVGGAGAWDQIVPAQHYHNDGGVTSTQVYQGTAAAIGEVVKDLAPAFLGTDFVRSVGPASRVLWDIDWWVDALGVTNIGPRPPAAPDASLELMTWEPLEQRAEVRCDVLVVPGTILTDSRIGASSVTVRDVEQVFDADGARATLWCAAQPVSRFAEALKSAVREFGETDYLKAYRYRIVLEGEDGRLQLQAVRPKDDGFPPALLPLVVWPGMAGDSAEHQPASEVLVSFIAGDRTQPVVRGFSPQSMPVKRTVDASGEVDIGPSAELVALAGGTTALVLEPWATGLIEALGTMASALASAATVANVAAAGSALGSALSSLPAAAAEKVVGQ